MPASHPAYTDFDKILAHRDNVQKWLSAWRTRRAATETTMAHWQFNQSAYDVLKTHVPCFDLAWVHDTFIYIILGQMPADQAVRRRAYQDALFHIGAHSAQMAKLFKFGGAQTMTDLPSTPVAQYLRRLYHRMYGSSYGEMSYQACMQRAFGDTSSSSSTQ